MWMRILLSSVMIFGSACAGSEPAAPPAPIETRVSRVFPKTADLGTSVLDVKVQMYNPCATPVGVEEVAYTVATGDDVGGTIDGVVPAGATLESEQQAEMGFEVDVPLPVERLADLVEMDVVPADISGVVLFADGTSARFTKKAGLAIPRLPNLVVFDAQAAQYGGQGIDVTFFLRLLNENPFTLPIEIVEYEVIVAGQSMRAEEAGLGSRLTAGAAEEYEVNIRLKEDFEPLPTILSTRDIDYRVRGSVRVKGLAIPFDHSGTIELASSDD